MQKEQSMPPVKPQAAGGAPLKLDETGRLYYNGVVILSRGAEIVPGRFLLAEPLEQLVLPLLLWYRENARVLPWRTHPTPYRVWVSEIMLQQTRVTFVLDYFERFMKALPALSDLAQVEEEELLKLWQGLGYYNRARNLKRAAQKIMTDYRGVFPDSYPAIRSLPGIGDYTAGAIASIAFGLPYPAVDGNVMRVAARIQCSEAPPESPAAKRELRERLLPVLPRDCPGEFNQALMELGATVCLPNGAPLCHRCPLSSLCLANLRGLTAEYPRKFPPVRRSVETRLVFLLFHDGQVALRKRPEHGLLAGLWEFPSLAAEPPLDDALARSHLLSWGLTPASLEPAGTGRHLFTHREWLLSGFAAELKEDSLPPGWEWVTRDQLRRGYALPAAFRCFLPRVTERLSKPPHPLP